MLKFVDVIAVPYFFAKIRMPGSPGNLDNRSTSIFVG